MAGRWTLLVAMMRPLLGNLVMNHGELEDTDHMIHMEKAPWRTARRWASTSASVGGRPTVFTHITRTFQRGNPVRHPRAREHERDEEEEERADDQDEEQRDESREEKERAGHRGIEHSGADTRGVEEPFLTERDIADMEQLPSTHAGCCGQAFWTCTTRTL